VGYLDIVLETHGTRVKKNQEMLSIIVPDKGKVDVPIREVESIIVGANVTITSQALRALSTQGINIIYSNFGKVYGLYTPFAMNGTVITRRNQLMAINDWRGRHIASQIVFATIENKRRLLLYFAKNRKKANPGLSMRLRGAAKKIGNLIQNLNRISKAINFGDKVSDIRAKLMGIEGRAASIYFIEYGNLFPQGFKTLTRSRRPPQNPLNSLLSLGYVFLMSPVITAIVSAGLELYGGFLHSDRSGKPSLALDLLEEFRQPVVDRLVARIVQRGQIKVDDFKRELQRYTLNDKKRAFFYSELRKELNGGQEKLDLISDLNSNKGSKKEKKVIYRKEMRNQARKLARYLNGSISSYEPFIMKW